MKYLIVNADDFGLTSGVNRAVIDGYRHGIITSTTIMANMPAFDEAVQLAKENTALGVGLHFNITQGKPVAALSEVQSLTNTQGGFLGNSVALAMRSLSGRLGTEEVCIELRAQIEKVLNAGLQLTHIDSHKHSHALPQVCGAIIETMKDYGIGAVRLPRERWHSTGQTKITMQSIGALALAQICRISSTKLDNNCVKTSDAFFGIAQTGFWTKEWLQQLIAHLPDGVSELMCHPGDDVDELKNVETRLRESRIIELELLTDPDVIGSINERGVRLVNYHHLSTYT